MKLSFSLSSKPNLAKPSQRPSSSEDKDTQKPNHEFVTEFDPSKTLAPQNPNKHQIPRLENTWNPHKKMKNIDLLLRSATTSEDDPNLRFEVEAPSTADTDSSMSYGLNLRSKENDFSTDISGTEDPHPPKVSIEKVLLQKFKQDMEILPEDRGLEEFDEVPVEGFGAALLGAYGWKEGQGIGRNVKKDVEVVQYLRRAGREGLGFEPEVKKEENNGREVLVAKKGVDGKTRHVVGIDEKLVPRELKGVHVGKFVRVVGGRHVGLKGKVLEKLDDLGVVVLNLIKSDEDVRVTIDQVAELGSVEEEKCLKKLQELRIKDERRRDGRRGSSSSHNKDKNNGEERRKGEHRSICRNGGGREEDKTASSVSWLRSHIRVRVISKDFKGGRLYLKKGKVVDVVGPTVCDISMDESKELIQGAHQNFLETALPRRGGPVLVLYGKHKGVFGDLVEKNVEKEVAVVRDADNQELFNVGLEQVAEYTGDPSLIGY